ncbi:helix-turn-helix domain-containing protein [Phytoactinopolyspora alkaliphila]|uniref:Helix-turn-helix domain-containing protein n=1 Tax=Phytoactinopolyspora alkaliphila TaxID=1783498 RepID=A0A6N9YHT9_9ACTN|nr:helix-turn-helix domain-containing protein [Phytoactinopolyspora alkaliphila]NED94490.1 helix-turn-helix domain-containing protein [Phytoactinopolyspora alkaliphila]
MATDQGAERSGSSAKALANGVTVLQTLVESDEPLSASEIARRVGLHQSSVSRILATLAEAGYARKTGYRSFAPDFGVLSLGAAAITKFRLAHQPRKAMEAAAQTARGMAVSLSVLWRGEVIYFLRTHDGEPPVLFNATGWPLHLSAPGLRLLLDLPEDEALEMLRKSREKYGWERPEPPAPQSEEEALRRGRELLLHDCLILDGWLMPGHMSSAITVDAPNEPPVALSITGLTKLADPDTIRLWLHSFRRSVEQSLVD